MLLAPPVCRLKDCGEGSLGLFGLRIASNWLLLHKTSVCSGGGALSCNFTDLNCALLGGRIALLLTTIWLRRISIAAVLGLAIKMFSVRA